jgi:tetraacyldisaccharide 4'-kinase
MGKSMKIKKYFYDVAFNKKKGTTASLVRFITISLSGIYHMLLRWLIFINTCGLLPRFKPKAKIISIGNITAGGTGKTPFEMFIVNNYLDKNKTAIISRGYNDDELNLLQYNLPQVKILSGKNRIQLIKSAQKLFNIEVILLDDGFQQWRIKKDLEFVLIDASNPFSNNRLLPAGLLREPLDSLKRADAIILTKTNEAANNIESTKETIRRYNKNADIIECSHRAVEIYEPAKKKTLNLESLKDKRIYTFCAIGSASSFRNSLEEKGLNIVGFKDYIDHYQYGTGDIDSIIKEAKDKKAEVIMTTEKDWMRLDANMIWKLSNSHKFYLLRIIIELNKNQNILNEKLSMALNN